MSDLLERLREREVPDWLRALYSVIYLATLAHAATTRGAWSCCPPAYGDDLATFAHAVQTAFGWTGATVAIMEVAIVMVLLVPKVYYGIKEKGRREGEREGADKMLEAMKEAGVDEETRRRVEGIHAKRNGR